MQDPDLRRIVEIAQRLDNELAAMTAEIVRLRGAAVDDARVWGRVESVLSKRDSEAPEIVAEIRAAMRYVP